MANTKELAKFIGYGMGAIGLFKTAELLLLQYLGNNALYWGGLSLIIILLTPYISNRIGGN